MKKELLNNLRCPVTFKRLCLEYPFEKDGRIESGLLTTEDGAEYPIMHGVPRFVPKENYANSFGFQWNRFRETQLDSHTGVPISRDRFYKSTEWSPGDLKGKMVLEVGCGAGRFTEILLSAGAIVVALDYSNAVDVCWKNYYLHPNLNVVQGDIYNLPFQEETFDFVFCFGVLQHTPDVKKAFMSLVPQLKKGGHLAVDVYRKRLRTIFWSKYWIRPFTCRMDPERLFRQVEKWVPVLLPVSIFIGRIPFVGKKLRYLIPVVNYDGIFPLTNVQIREWAILDTFDMLSPRYDQPQSTATLLSWLKEAGMTDIKVFHPAHLVGQGRKV
jgi:2-polyprenyl-3-methyl-5-hydroxy-6-metoxy-1,4-benzoquinol methylase